ncbi:hypothetical protein [Mycolicibacterium mageritense]|uniref:hypothetical protein n=1 Tax=Mycolicibacterium mageritense TaxID=53462 RepID=UPI0011DB82CD|nr:hypothetical protein [Mycolicibacterium mageritense]TXI56454.1 MAG: hypothetical protein E6Q55_28730 [Mycolicibacterium mageritense]
MDYSLITLAPRAAAGTYQAIGADPVTVMAYGDILSNSKVMALAIPGVLGIFLIVIGTFWTIRKVKEGIGEALMFQIGLIVLGVVVVLSVGIAAGVTDFFVDQGVVDSQYYDADVWGK